jgi:hypothetical protein
MSYRTFQQVVRAVSHVTPVPEPPRRHFSSQDIISIINGLLISIVPQSAPIRFLEFLLASDYDLWYSQFKAGEATPTKARLTSTKRPLKHLPGTSFVSHSKPSKHFRKRPTKKQTKQGNGGAPWGLTGSSSCAILAAGLASAPSVEPLIHGMLAWTGVLFG